MQTGVELHFATLLGVVFFSWPKNTFYKKNSCYGCIFAVHASRLLNDSFEQVTRKCSVKVFYGQLHQNNNGISLSTWHRWYS